MAKFDFETLTIEEVEMIENLSGVSIDSFMDEGAFKGKALKAIIYVFNKKKDPNYTIEQAAKVSFKDAMAMFSGEDENPKAE